MHTDILCTSAVGAFRVEGEKLARLGGLPRALLPLAVAAPVATSSKLQDFLAGIDPLGAWTARYGQEAEEAGLTEGAHRRKQLIGAAGGLAGGAILVPSAVMGAIGGITGLATGEGLLGKLQEAGRQAATSAKEPLGLVYHGGKATRYLGHVVEGRQPKIPTKSLKFTLERMPLKAVTDGLARVADRGGMEKALHRAAKQRYAQGLAQLALGGLIGAGGAYIQYARGREAERAFRGRETK